jgi:hypothetical protein
MGFNYFNHKTHLLQKKKKKKKNYKERKKEDLNGRVSGHYPVPYNTWYLCPKKYEKTEIPSAL